MTQSGVVTFEPSPEGTRVHLEMNDEAERWTNKVADFLNIVEHRVQGAIGSSQRPERS